MKATWLFSEHPLVIDVKLATVIKLNPSIVLQQLNYWLHSSSAKKINGKLWIYNSVKDWNKQFPFWGINTVQRILDSLEEDGLIESGNFNRLKFDRTKWYTINYEELSKRMEKAGMTDSGKNGNGLPQNGEMETPKMGKSNTPEWGNANTQNGVTNTRDYTETTTETTNKGRKSRKAKQYDHDSPEYQTARYLYELIITNNEKFKKPHLQRWADTVRLMHERDGRSFEDIRAVANYAQHSSFWMSNVLSMNKLRKQFDRLYMQAKKAKPQPKEKDWSSWDNYGR